MKKYMMSFAIIALSLSSLVEAVLWEGVRNNTFVGVIINMTGGSFNNVTFTLPRGAIVYNTSQAQLKIQGLLTGIANLNDAEYDSLNEKVKNERSVNRDKRPVLYINTMSYSIVWETADQFRTDVFTPRQ